LACQANLALKTLYEQIEKGELVAPWSVIDGLVLFQKRIYIPPACSLFHTILEVVHAMGHEGVQKMSHRFRKDFHTPQSKRVVQDFIKSCSTCQRNKTDHLHPAGLLLPLPVPAQVWSDISIDFVEGLPKVGDKSVLTVVDRLSKYAHFILLAHPYTAEMVARVFFTEIVRLHGIPTSIVSDRDPVFTSAYWQALFRAIGSKLHMSSAFHPQSDGQTEAVNKTIGMYLRCMTGAHPRNWITWLPWAEFVYNSSFHTTLKETPLKLVYGWDPPTFRSYDIGEIRVAAVAQSMAERDEFIEDVRLRLEQAQQYAKLQYDKSHRELVLQVEDWVWVKLCHRPIASVAHQPRGKPAPCFFRPYKIVDKINEVAYKLDLPSSARIHNVFHAGLLKKFIGLPPDEPPALPPMNTWRGNTHT
jgi:transposase InsO family protein